MTVESSIEAALFAHALALSITGSPELAWPNTPFTPPAGSPYIRVDHFPNSSTRRFLKGSDPHLRQGILQLIVVTPLNGGPSVATGLAGEIAEHFPADLDLFEGGIRIRIQQAPSIMPADKTDVSWDCIVSVRYEAFA